MDAERSRRLLLAAGLDEFAAKGFAGARVHEIAARAGVNKQLINYYFGGKEGLYRAIQREWLAREAAFHDPDRTAAEVAVSYLREGLDDPRGTRLMIWRALSDEGAPDEEPEQDLSGMTSRQQTGELDPALDAGSLMLMMIGAVSAPVVMPDLVRKIFGTDPSDPAFAERYSAHIRELVRRLGPGTPQ